MTADRLREARRALGLSQAALGAALGITGRMVRYYEARHTRIPKRTAARVEEMVAVGPLGRMDPEHLKTALRVLRIPYATAAERFGYSYEVFLQMLVGRRPIPPAVRLAIRAMF